MAVGLLGGRQQWVLLRAVATEQLSSNVHTAACRKSLRSLARHVRSDFLDFATCRFVFSSVYVHSQATIKLPSTFRSDFQHLVICEIAVCEVPQQYLTRWIVQYLVVSAELLRRTSFWFAS